MMQTRDDTTYPSRYLHATKTVEKNHPRIQALAERLRKGCTNDQEVINRLFLFVRDSVLYNPFVPFFELDHYRASVTLERGNGYCVQKAVLLAALARACQYPAALIFADIRNHLASAEMQEMMGTNLFAYHAYTQIWIKNHWIQLTPAFHEALCHKHGYPLVVFNGLDSAIFPDKTSDGRNFVDYVRHHGTFEDVPIEQLLTAWVDTYGQERVQLWKEAIGNLKSQHR